VTGKATLIIVPVKVIAAWKVNIRGLRRAFEHVNFDISDSE